MPTTSSHLLPYPEGSDPADVPADLGALAEAVDAKLDAIAPSQVAGATSGQLLIANSSGVLTSRTVTGDVTFSNTGEAQIAAGAVGTTELASNAVTTVKVEDASITRPKLAASVTRQEINAKTASYTLLSSDLWKLVTVTSASATTVTVNTSLALSPGESIDVARMGTGTVTFAAASGVTLNGTPGLLLRDQYSLATVFCLATNQYVVFGDLDAA